MDAFKDIRELAYVIKDIADIEFTARPYNRFEPEKSIWWLIPSTEWPAFKYGKIFFDEFKEVSEKSGIVCGFYIEKGISQELNGLYKGSFIMEKDWLWNEFIDSIKNKNEEIYSIISNLTSLPYEIFLTIKTSYTPPEKANYLDSPENFYSQKDDFRASVVTFKIRGQFELILENKETNPSNCEVAEYFESEIIPEKQLDNLALKICNIPRLSWLWVDLNIGVLIPQNENDITPAELWNNYLKPWKPWLRKGGE